MCQGFNHCSEVFLHHFVSAKLAGSIRVKRKNISFKGICRSFALMAFHTRQTTQGLRFVCKGSGEDLEHCQ